MADTKDQPRHGRDVTGKDDPARTRPYTFNEPRPKEEIVQQAYDHEDPTPTQAELDQAKLDSIYQPEGSGDPQMAERQKKERDMAAQQGGGYQTRQSTPTPAQHPAQTPKVGS